MSAYDEGYLDGQKGCWNCKYQPETSGHREYSRGYFEATQDG